MPEKKQPLKPLRPITSIAFSDKGKVSQSQEVLPRTQKELEIAIGDKFTSSLSYFFGIHITEMVSGDGRGDLICKDENGSEVKIQIVEAVDHVQRQLRDQRTSYLSAIINAISSSRQLYDGCKITLIDSGNAPFWPSVKTRAGKELLADIVQRLVEFGNNLSTLETGKIRVRKWLLNTHQIKLYISCERLVSEANDSFWSWGGARTVLENEDMSFILAAIKQKINKHYSKPDGSFWLLVYSTDTLRATEDPEFNEIRMLLEQTQHPFDKVWYIFPYDNKKLGHTVLIWQQKSV